jgi:septal ring factor EnvC (AmiA/AmiB activator)
MCVWRLSPHPALAAPARSARVTIKAGVQDTQARLQAAAAERGEYRAHLLDAQAELQQTRSELVAWAEGLTELREVMEGLDDDLGALFGEGEYREAVASAVEAAEAMGLGAALSGMARRQALQC